MRFSEFFTEKTAAANFMVACLTAMEAIWFHNNKSDYGDICAEADNKVKDLAKEYDLPLSFVEGACKSSANSLVEFSRMTRTCPPPEAFPRVAQVAVDTLW